MIVEKGDSEGLDAVAVGTIMSICYSYLYSMMHHVVTSVPEIILSIRNVIDPCPLFGCEVSMRRCLASSLRRY